MLRDFSTVGNIIDNINKMLWDDGFIFLIFAACIFLSVRCGFVQLHLKSLFGAVFGKKEGESGRQRFRAISTSLAASMGTGNIIGTAAALAMGGEGAVFWMTVTAFFGMAAAYCENYLGVLFGKKNTGQLPPASYISQTILGKTGAAVYTAVCVGGSLAMGNMLQGNAVCCSAAELTGADIHIVSAVFAAAAGLAIAGGAEKTASAAEKMIPPASVSYILFTLYIIIINHDNIIPALCRIISSAFDINAAAAGVGGFGISRAISIGMRRGIFSNEAGLGSSVTVHSQSGCTSPDRAGKWAACEVFIDTVVCCTLTALAIISSGADIHGKNALSCAFSSAGGRTGEIFLPVSIIIFAAASMLGWCCCGELCLKNIIHSRKAVWLYRAAHIALLYVGGTADISVLWGTADIFNWVMLVINLTAVLLLSYRIKAADSPL